MSPTDPNVDATIAAAQQIIASAADIQETITSQQNQITDDAAAVQQLNATISSQAATISTQAAEIKSDTAQIAQDAHDIADLRSQLVNAITLGTALPSAIFKQFNRIERMDGWLLAPGSTANTGQTGSKGTGSITLNADESAATLACIPNGPYYDALVYRPFANPVLTLGLILYRAEFMLDAADFSLSQALEMDGSLFNGTHRFQPAGQINMHTRTLWYYDPSIPNWVDTHLPVGIAADAWMPVEIVGQVDQVKNTFTYLGAAIADTYHALGIVVAARAKTVANPFIHASLQADSNSKGVSYKASVRKVSLGWL